MISTAPLTQSDQRHRRLTGHVTPRIASRLGHVTERRAASRQGYTVTVQHELYNTYSVGGRAPDSTRAWPVCGERAAVES